MWGLHFEIEPRKMVWWLILSQKSSMYNPTVLIVGAGPVGMMCASKLSSAGISVTVIEKVCWQCLSAWSWFIFLMATGWIHPPDSESLDILVSFSLLYYKIKRNTNLAGPRSWLISRNWAYSKKSKRLVSQMNEQSGSGGIWMVIYWQKCTGVYLRMRLMSVW